MSTVREPVVSLTWESVSPSLHRPGTSRVAHLGVSVPLTPPSGNQSCRSPGSQCPPHSTVREPVVSLTWESVSPSLHRLGTSRVAHLGVSVPLTPPSGNQSCRSPRSQCPPHSTVQEPVVSLTWESVSPSLHRPGTSRVAHLGVSVPLTPPSGNQSCRSPGSQCPPHSTVQEPVVSLTWESVSPSLHRPGTSRVAHLGVSVPLTPPSGNQSCRSPGSQCPPHSTVWEPVVSLTWESVSPSLHRPGTSRVAHLGVSVPLTPPSGNQSCRSPGSQCPPHSTVREPVVSLTWESVSPSLHRPETSHVAHLGVSVPLTPPSGNQSCRSPGSQCPPHSTVREPVVSLTWESVSPSLYRPGTSRVAHLGVSVPLTLPSGNQSCRSSGSQCPPHSTVPEPVVSLTWESVSPSLHRPGTSRVAQLGVSVPLTPPSGNQSCRSPGSQCPPHSTIREPVVSLTWESVSPYSTIREPVVSLTWESVSPSLHRPGTSRVAHLGVSVPLTPPSGNQSCRSPGSQCPPHSTVREPVVSLTWESVSPSLHRPGTSRVAHLGVSVPLTPPSGNQSCRSPGSQCPPHSTVREPVVSLTWESVSPSLHRPGTSRVAHLGVSVPPHSTVREPVVSLT